MTLDFLKMTKFYTNSRKIIPFKQNCALKHIGICMHAYTYTLTHHTISDWGITIFLAGTANVRGF